MHVAVLPEELIAAQIMMVMSKVKEYAVARVMASDESIRSVVVTV